MRLKIEFEMDGIIILPYNYRQGLQAFIYSALGSAESVELHDQEDGLIKPFVFSNIIGKYSADEYGIVFEGKCSFYLTSSRFEILNDFYNFCIRNKVLSLFGNYIALRRISQVLYKQNDGPINYRTI